MTTLHHEQVTERGKAIRESKSLRDMCAAFGIESEYDVLIAARRSKAAELGILLDPDDDAYIDEEEDHHGGVDGADQVSGDQISGDQLSESNRKRRRLTPSVGDDGIVRVKVVSVLSLRV